MKIHRIKDNDTYSQYILKVKEVFKRKNSYLKSYTNIIKINLDKYKVNNTNLHILIWIFYGL